MKEALGRHENTQAKISSRKANEIGSECQCSFAQLVRDEVINWLPGQLRMFTLAFKREK